MPKTNNIHDTSDDDLDLLSDLSIDDTNYVSTDESDACIEDSTREEENREEEPDILSQQQASDIVAQICAAENAKLKEKSVPTIPASAFVTGTASAFVTGTVPAPASVADTAPASVTSTALDSTFATSSLLSALSPPIQAREFTPISVNHSSGLNCPVCIQIGAKKLRKVHIDGKCTMHYRQMRSAPGRKKVNEGAKLVKYQESEVRYRRKMTDRINKIVQEGERVYKEGNQLVDAEKEADSAFDNMLSKFK